MFRQVLRVDPYGDLFRYRTRERLRKLLSPRWIKNRLAASAYALRHPDAPWLVPAALEEIDSRVRPDEIGFEWGSGLSTPWLAKRLRSLVAVEHNGTWALKVQAMLDSHDLANAEVRLVPEAQYLAQMEEVTDGSLDVVLIDGIFMGRALALSLPKLRHGGLLALNRAHLTLPSASATPEARSRAEGPDESLDPAAFVELQRWPHKWFSDGINDTAVFTKP